MNKYKESKKTVSELNFALNPKMALLTLPFFKKMVFNTKNV